MSYKRIHVFLTKRPFLLNPKRWTWYKLVLSILIKSGLIQYLISVVVDRFFFKFLFMSAVCEIDLDL